LAPSCRRIGEGECGLCVKRGEPIPDGRLDLLPDAALCVGPVKPSGRLLPAAVRRRDIMIEALQNRIVELAAATREAGASADASAQKELLEDLERHIEELEARGGKVPENALHLVRPDDDSEVEDQFDNMPI